jgi:hypothetical protein
MKTQVFLSFELVVDTATNAAFHHVFILLFNIGYTACHVSYYKPKTKTGSDDTRLDRCALSTTVPQKEE